MPYWFEPQTASLEVGGKELIIETGRMAKQASGAAVVTYGDAVVLVTAVSGPAREGVEARGPGPGCRLPKIGFGGDLAHDRQPPAPGRGDEGSHRRLVGPVSRPARGPGHDEAVHGGALQDLEGLGCAPPLQGLGLHSMIEIAGGHLLRARRQLTQGSCDAPGEAARKPEGRNQQSQAQQNQREQNCR